MRIYKLTNFVLDLIAALDSGRCQDVTLEEVRQQVVDGTVFEFLNRRLEFNGALSVLEPVDRLELLLEWEMLHARMGPYVYQGLRNGLCVLLNYLLEGIARRAETRDYRLTPETCGAAVAGGEGNR
ncbi:MAG: hypothetical protein HY763_12170 [Planctomycetes bacterium]|nr:hypothetical protein [Planctomycetota bacterium]